MPYSGSISNHTHLPHIWARYGLDLAWVWLTCARSGPDRSQSQYLCGQGVVLFIGVCCVGVIPDILFQSASLTPLQCLATLLEWSGKCQTSQINMLTICISSDSCTILDVVLGITAAVVA